MSSKLSIALYRVPEFVCKLRRHLETKNYKIVNFQVLWHWKSIRVTKWIKTRLAIQVEGFEREEITLVRKMTFVWKMSSSTLHCEFGCLDRFSRGFFPVLANSSGPYTNIVCDCCSPHNFQFNIQYNRNAKYPTVRANNSH
jgi:hypothetical protein